MIDIQFKGERERKRERKDGGKREKREHERGRKMGEKGENEEKES